MLKNNGVYGSTCPRCGEPKTRLAKYCKSCHATYFARVAYHDNSSIDRTVKILEMRNKGISFSRIAKEIGVTRQRAHQIYSNIVSEQLNKNP